MKESIAGRMREGFVSVMEWLKGSKLDFTGYDNLLSGHSWPLRPFVFDRLFD